MKPIFGIILFLTLSACGKQTVALSTETPIPTTVSPTSVPTSTLIPVTVTPSPMPTEPIIPIITPNPAQVERWNEYEDALALAFFKSYYQPEEVVCEWVILGQTDQEVYVWAHCASIYSAGPSQGSIPTVIRIGANGSVQNAEIPGSGTAYGPSILRLFPPDLQEIIFDHSVLFSQEQTDRLRWRRGHPDEPPWIVFSTLTIQPTQPVIPMITPDSVQVERWGEYQTALAGQLDYRPPENTLCEWELLGRSGNEVYVWAICGEIFGHRPSLESLVVIYTLDDGSVTGALRSEDRSMFPSSVQEKYFGGLIHFQELVDHLRWRQRHPEEPPLIVLSAPPIP
jgi:hypothetical protein